jgi:hypothetical protein
MHVKRRYSRKTLSFGQVESSASSLSKDFTIEMSVDSSTIPSFSASATWCQNNIKGTVLNEGDWLYHREGAVDCSGWPGVVRVGASSTGVYGFYVSNSCVYLLLV